MNWYDVFDKETIKDIKKHQDNLDELLSIINDLMKNNYNLGYENGYGAKEDETNIIC